MTPRCKQEGKIVGESSFATYNAVFISPGDFYLLLEELPILEGRLDEGFE
jgi:hypothetical protein